MDAPRALTSFGDEFGMKSAATGVDVAAVRRDVEQRDFGAAIAVEAAKKFRRDGGSSAVGAVGHDFEVGERKAGKGIDEELDVIGLQRGIVFDGREAAGSEICVLGRMMQNFLFHGEFQRVGQFESVAAEELDAVILPGICEAEITTPA